MRRVSVDGGGDQQRPGVALPARQVDDAEDLAGHRVPDRRARAGQLLQLLDVVLVAEHLRRPARLQRRADAVRADEPLGVAEPGGQPDAVEVLLEPESPVRRLSTTPSASQRITLTGSVANRSAISPQHGLGRAASRASRRRSGSNGRSRWSGGRARGGTGSRRPGSVPGRRRAAPARRRGTWSARARSPARPGAAGSSNAGAPAGGRGVLGPASLLGQPVPSLVSETVRASGADIDDPRDSREANPRNGGISRRLILRPLRHRRAV